MDHYLEIRLLPDPEFAAPLLMNALFGKLHRALVDLDSRRIGISFPQMQSSLPALGETLRLHGSGDGLRQLLAGDWLQGMRDHLVLDGPLRVPAGAQHRVVRRVQAKSSPERLLRRLVRRRRIDEDTARRLIPELSAQRLSLPYVHMKSRSSGQMFRLFIDQGPPGDTPVAGAFSNYGLSATATVPWF